MDSLHHILDNKLDAQMLQDNSTHLSSQKKYTIADYPMLEKHSADIKTPTGKGLDQMTLAQVEEGLVSEQDLRISKEMLYAQAEIAQSAGKHQLGENLKRAAELTNIPDQEIIQMYDCLRPHRSTYEQLIALATKLEETYHAPICAALVRDAAQVYEKRGITRR